MKVLAILILLTLQMVDCLWYQQGHWTCQLSSNSSFLFTFLGEEGYARIKGDRDSKILQIILTSSKGSDRIIQIQLKMVSERYQSDLNFHAKNLTATTIFHTEDGTTYAQKEVQISNTLPFNVSLTRRKSLELRSAQGVFYIKLIDIEEISPRIYYYMWLLLILVVVLGQSFLVLYFPDINKQVQPTLGFWSVILIQGLLIKFVFSIFTQSFYLTETTGSTILKSIIFLAGGFFILEMIAIGIVLIDQTPRDHKFFTVTSYITAVILSATYFITLIPLRLWHCLAVVVVYEIVTIFYKKFEDTSRKHQKMVALGILYLFPCFIFPAFSFEIKYPQEEVELWWLYGTLYFAEVTVFLLKAGVCFKIKRLIKLKLHKQFNSQDYQNLEEKACPLCLKEVENSEIGLNAAGEAPQVEWIQAECGHHFHKTCVRQNMQEDSCLFDNTKWTEEFKNAAHQ